MCWLVLCRLDTTWGRKSFNRESASIGLALYVSMLDVFFIGDGCGSATLRQAVLESVTKHEENITSHEEKASKQCFSMASASRFPALSSCPYFPGQWTLHCKGK